MLNDFSNRAEEFIRLAQRTHSPRDRDLFIELARACYGMEDKPPEGMAQKTQTH